MVNLVNKQSIVILLIFLQFVNLFIPSCAKKVEIQMFPSDKERVVGVGITFNITCMYPSLVFYGMLQRSYNITWSLPRIYDEDTYLLNKMETVYYRRDVVFISTLTLFNATSEQTGYYSCHCVGFNPFRIIDTATQYVYVKGEKLLTMATYKFNFFDDHGVKIIDAIYADEKSDITIPCIATQPNVTVSYYRITFVMMLNSTDLKEIIFNNIQISNSTKSKYANNRTSGLTIQNVRTSDSGLYKCSASLGNVTDELSTLLIVEGMELTMIGGNQMIEEGSNITLLCSAFLLNDFRGLQWSYGKKMNIINYIDKKNPPKGLPLLQERTYPTYPSYNSYMQYLKMALEKLKMDSKKIIDVILDFQASELRLYNVTRQSLDNNYFECAELQEQKKTSNGISLRIKSNEKDEENVQIEMGRKQTITCTTTANATNFQWFKHKEPIYTTADGQPTAAQLTLEGVPNDVGSYECNYVDKYGDLQRRTFVVTAAPNESNQDTIALFVGLPLAIVSIAFASALLWFCCRRRKVFPNAEKLLEGIQETDVYYRQKEDEACAQPYDKRWEFPRNRLKLGKELGAGCFGRVLKGEAIGINDRAATNDITTTVAVKMIRSRSLDAYRELESLVAELKIMIYLGPHLNVVSLLGACTKNITKGKLLVILEYCPFGNLQSFLNDPNHEFNDGLDDGYVDAFQGERIRCSAGYLPMQTSSVSAGTTVQSRPPAMQFGEHHTSSSATKVQLNSGDYTIARGESTRLTYSTRDLISWSWQITRGMGHLANKKVVHGDLAARNVLLSNNGVVKVADFGLARRTYYKEYCTGMGPLPMKWMAIESLTSNTFTTQSDVWSYGVTLWELFSLGKSPYPGIEWKQLVNELESGFRMEKPSNAPNFIGEIMNSCWEMEPKERPTFQQLEDTLFKHLHSSVSSYYLQLEIASLSKEQC